MNTIRMPGGMGAWLQPRAAIQQMEDDIQREAVRRLVVNTCYEVIRDCPDPALRVEAAQLLAQVSAGGRLL
jgi:hypothetical protein